MDEKDVAVRGVVGQVGVAVDEQKVKVEGAGGDAGQVASITMSSLPTVEDFIAKYQGMPQEVIIGDICDRLEDIRNVVSTARNQAVSARENASDAKSELKKFLRSL